MKNLSPLTNSKGNEFIHNIVYSTGTFKFKLYFISIKIHFKKIHGQHENCLLEIQFLKITSLKTPILQDGLCFIFWRSAAWCCAVSNFLSLSHTWVFRTEQSEPQECCNYVSKDGLPDKGHNQWTIEIQAATIIHYQVCGKIQALSTSGSDLLFLCLSHTIIEGEKPPNKPRFKVISSPSFPSSLKINHHCYKLQAVTSWRDHCFSL